MAIKTNQNKLALHVPCLLDQYMPETVFNMVKHLEKLGFTIEYPENQTCCGYPALDYGLTDQAKEVGEKFLTEFTGQFPSVSAGTVCVNAIRNWYGDLFNNSMQHNNCKRTQKNFFHFTELLLQQKNNDKITYKGIDKNATWIHSCMAKNICDINEIQQHILDKFENTTFEIIGQEPTFCCGFGGWFSSHHPEVAEQKTASLVTQLKASGHTTVIIDEPGCLIHLQTYFKANNIHINIVHPADFIEEINIKKDE